MYFISTLILAFAFKFICMQMNWRAEAFGGLPLIVWDMWIYFVIMFFFSPDFVASIRRGIEIQSLLLGFSNRSARCRNAKTDDCACLRNVFLVSQIDKWTFGFVVLINRHIYSGLYSFIHHTRTLRADPSMDSRMKGNNNKKTQIHAKTNRNGRSTSQMIINCLRTVSHQGWIKNYNKPSPNKNENNWLFGNKCPANEWEMWPIVKYGQWPPFNYLFISSWSSLLMDDLKMFLELPSIFLNGQVFDILWSDPQHNEGCQPNGLRGAGTYYGPDVTQNFLQKNKLVFLVRSHECKHDGYEIVHGGKVRSENVLHGKSVSFQGIHCCSVLVRVFFFLLSHSNTRCK